MAGLVASSSSGAGSMEVLYINDHAGRDERNSSETTCLEYLAGNRDPNGIVSDDNPERIH